jgi:hypothetical protein
MGPLTRYTVFHDLVPVPRNKFLKDTNITQTRIPSQQRRIIEWIINNTFTGPRRKQSDNNWNINLSAAYRINRNYKTLIQNSQCPDRDSNWAPPDHNTNRTKVIVWKDCVRLWIVFRWFSGRKQRITECYFEDVFEQLSRSFVRRTTVLKWFN